MPRPARITYPRAFYHVMNRGAGRRDIFHSDIHRNLFLDTISEASQKLGILIHAYCLMSNHYHLIIETPHANLSRAMQYINGIYAQKYNRLKKIDGPLFRGRFKAILIDADAYLLQLNRYIHKNPIATKNKLVKKLEDYRWSSYRAYLKMDPTPSWLHKDKTLAMLGVKHNLKKYKIYIENENDEFIDKFYHKESVSAIMGGKNFREKIKNKKNIGAGKDKDINNELQKKFLPRQVIEVAAKIFAVKKSDILTRQKGRAHNNFPRKFAMYMCYNHCLCKLSELVKFFNLKNVGSVSKAVFDVKMELGNGRYMEEVFEMEKGLWLMK